MSASIDEDITSIYEDMMDEADESMKNFGNFLKSSLRDVSEIMTSRDDYYKGNKLFSSGEMIRGYWNDMKIANDIDASEKNRTVYYADDPTHKKLIDAAKDIKSKYAKIMKEYQSIYGSLKDPMVKADSFDVIDYGARLARICDELIYLRGRICAQFEDNPDLNDPDLKKQALSERSRLLKEASELYAEAAKKWSKIRAKKKATESATRIKQDINAEYDSFIKRFQSGMESTTSIIHGQLNSESINSSIDQVTSVMESIRSLKGKIDRYKLNSIDTSGLCALEGAGYRLISSMQKSKDYIEDHWDISKEAFESYLDEKKTAYEKSMKSIFKQWSEIRSSINKSIDDKLIERNPNVSVGNIVE